MKSFAFCMGIVCLLLAGGCGDGTRNSGADLVRTLNRDLPRGWSATLGAAAPELPGLSLAAEDILVWKTESVALRRSPEALGDSARPYFLLEARPLLEPAEARERLRAHREIRRQHEALDQTVGHLSRTMDGSFIVRGWTEENEIRDYREAKAELPELADPPPGHFFRDRAYVIHDTRSRIIPEAREEQTAMNVAYGVIARTLEAY
ncbi:MAG: hypothetical protein JJU29_06280 [Verrucomicrobia bacterium]|nr:hypothetical protein [Verrucomicrobiota bacterium]MCH8511474.1 hypothetical protein [Kiritimatiellia bacterium]